MFAKRQISTAYTLVSVIAVTLSLGFDKNWSANNSSCYFRALTVIRQDTTDALAS